jgi:molecular chaperone GrpE
MNDEENKKEEITDDVEFVEEGEGLEPQKKIKKLRDELKRVQKERDEYLAGWQRSKADFINARKEEEKSRAETIKFANKEFAQEILAVADSFDMAFANKESWEKVDKNWRTGVEYIYSQLLSVLEQNGLKQINPIGEKFDPNIHTSVESVPTTEEDEDKVMEVVQKGYLMNGTLIRSPKVKVGVKK